jgi:exosome complex exonuclease DIS3/RRP44
MVILVGKVGDKATENQVLLLEHDIPHSSFSEAVMECMPRLPWEITRKVPTVRGGFHFCLSAKIRCLI